MVCLSRPYVFKFYEGCLSQILLIPSLNTLTQINDLLPNKYLSTRITSGPDEFYKKTVLKNFTEFIEKCLC